MGGKRKGTLHLTELLLQYLFHVMCHAALVLLITLAWLSEKTSWDGWRIIMLPFYEILMNSFAYFGLCDSVRARTQHHFTLPGAYFVYVLAVAVTVYTRCLCSYFRRRRLWISLSTKISTSVPRPFSIGLLTQTKSASLNRWKLCSIQAAPHSNFRATPLWYFFFVVMTAAIRLELWMLVLATRRSHKVSIKYAAVSMTMTASLRLWQSQRILLTYCVCWQLFSYWRWCDRWKSLV